MTDFKVGDRVRRRHGNERYPEYAKGAEFIVSEISGYGTVVTSPDGAEHASFCLELVEEPEIKVGDRVRATSKTNDDTAEFKVIYVDLSGSVESRRNYFSCVEWNFEVIAPPKPTPQQVWDSFPIGQRFYLGNEGPEYDHLKVSPTKFYHPRGDSLYEAAYCLNFGVIPIND